jgi:hypothetical protein
LSSYYIYDAFPTSPVQYFLTIQYLHALAYCTLNQGLQHTVFRQALLATQRFLVHFQFKTGLFLLAPIEGKEVIVQKIQFISIYSQLQE